MKKESLLLHTCCGPCTLGVPEHLLKAEKTTMFFFNPSIYPEEEYQKRLDAARIVAETNGLEFIEQKVDHKRWQELMKGLENEPEGGKRCEECIKHRLQETSRKAHELGLDLFTTTLSVSPHKDAGMINDIGKSLSDTKTSYLKADFSKEGGFKKSIELSRKLGLYRQKYCGCEYSRK